MNNETIADLKAQIADLSEKQYKLIEILLKQGTSIIHLQEQLLRLSNELREWVEK